MIRANLTIKLSNTLAPETYIARMEAKDPCDLYTWQRFSPDVTTSGRLRESHLVDLANLGVRHVVDLAPVEHEDVLTNEGAMLAQLGIEHTKIVVPFNQPTEEHYRAFVEAYENGPKPVHVHCLYNYRVSAFFFRYHVESGMPLRQARALMKPHWSPDASKHPAAKPWKEFIEAVLLRVERQRQSA